MNAKYDLSGKTALLTGAAGLLGGEHARGILQHGGAIVLTDVDQSGLEKQRIKLVKEFGQGNVTALIMDVTNEVSINRAAEDLIAAGIHISILINNAAIDPKVNAKNTLGEESRLENFSLEQWNLELAVGLTGAFLCSKVFGTLMAASEKAGVILNIASDLSVISPDQRLYSVEGLTPDLQPVKPITYSAIKSGIVGLTRYIATYWAGKNIRCNSLSPGGVENGQGQDFTRKLISRIPEGRMATTDEYRAAIQFLCSDASQYMNGQNIVMDGGRSVW
jgi:NAD(P)-dependent dehydrogenase (short-subunit alcohol dehydrogenase family)